MGIITAAFFVIKRDSKVTTNIVYAKSLASIGGFIAGDADTINFIRHTCRTYIFSASDTPAATAAALPPEEPPEL